jgi:hypothetical protein
MKQPISLFEDADGRGIAGAAMRIGYLPRAEKEFRKLAKTKRKGIAAIRANMKLVARGVLPATTGKFKELGVEHLPGNKGGRILMAEFRSVDDGIRLYGAIVDLAEGKTFVALAVDGDKKRNPTDRSIIETAKRRYVEAREKGDVP